MDVHPCLERCSHSLTVNAETPHLANRHTVCTAALECEAEQERHADGKASSKVDQVRCTCVRRSRLLSSLQERLSTKVTHKRLLHAVDLFLTQPGASMLQGADVKPARPTALASGDHAKTHVRGCSGDPRDLDDVGDGNDNDLLRDQCVKVAILVPSTNSNHSQAYKQPGQKPTFTFSELAAAAKTRHGSAPRALSPSAGTGFVATVLSDTPQSTTVQLATALTLPFGTSKSTSSVVIDRMPRRKPVRALRSP